MTPKSCLDCPSRLDPTQTVRFFGVSFGDDVSTCAQYGHVLGKPGLGPDATERLYNAFGAGADGKGCSKHGEQPPPFTKDGTPVKAPRALVVRPDADIHFRADGSPRPAATDEERASIPSCLGCANFVPAPIVQAELGWNMGLCALQGRLITNNRVMVEKSNCTLPIAGTPRKDTDGLELIKVYKDVFSFATIGMTKAQAVFDPTAAAEDPRSYVSDDELTDADKAYGIRAWRKVVHPRNPTKSVLLPIFDELSFDEVERAKIPQMGDGSGVENYVDWAHLLYKMGATIMGMDKNPVLIGSAGTGKTEALQFLAWQCQMPFERISMTRTSEVDDLIGKWIFEDGATKWINGRFTKGWSSRSVVVIDEYNAAPDEVEQALRPCFDNVKQLVLDGGKGGRVARHPYSFIGLTMNPSWDVKYTGLNEISAAGLNRLSLVAVDLPNEETERAIIAKFCSANDIKITAKELDKVMAIAKELRVQCDPQTGVLPIAWGIRPQLAVVAALPYFELMEAYKLAAIDALDPIAANIVIALVKGYE